jgi:hypothetical protein
MEVGCVSIGSRKLNRREFDSHDDLYEHLLFVRKLIVEYQ